MEVESKGITDELGEWVDLIADALNEVDPALNAWFALTQIAPQHFAGFAGFVTNPQK